ncbi:MAG: hypothetical protein ACJAYU_005323, partial [Bradymonadia bacterium]
SDEDTSDEDTSDEDTSDEDTSDEDTSDEDTSDEDTFDEDTFDEDSDTRVSSDEDTLDEDVDSPDFGPDDAPTSDVREADGSYVQYAETVESGRMSEDLYETSGIVRSRLHDDLYWIHGDSGQDHVARGINGAGEILAVLCVVDA